MPKAYENKRFFHWESALSASNFDCMTYLDKICASGWLPYNVKEGSGEKVVGDGRTIPIFYVSVLATKEKTVKALEDEPESQE